MRGALVLGLLIAANPALAHPCHGPTPLIVLPGGAVPLGEAPAPPPEEPCAPVPEPGPGPEVRLNWAPGIPAVLVALGAARRRRAWAAAPAFAAGAGLVALAAPGDLVPVLGWSDPALLALAAVALGWPRAALPAALWAGAVWGAAQRIDLLLEPAGGRLLWVGLGATVAAMALAAQAGPVWRRVGPWPPRVLASWSLAAALMAAALQLRA